MPRSRTRKSSSSVTAPPRRITRSTSGSSASKIAPSDPRFGQQLDRNGVVFARSRVQPPADLDELLADLNRSRESKSPSECEYRAYLEGVETSYNEDTMMRTFDSIAKVQRHRARRNDPDARRYVTVYNMQWTESTAGIQEGLSNPKPDVMETLTTDSYPNEALEALGGALAPTKYPPAMPAFIMHAKGPNGHMDEAEKQCAYDGAVAVQSAFHAHEYLADPRTSFEDETHALTVAFNGEDLSIYANHRTSDGKYHCYPLATNKPRFSSSHYKMARRQLRNAQDWGRRRAERTCDQLWSKARRDAAMHDRRRIQRELEDAEDTLRYGILTPPPSSNHMRKKIHKRESGSIVQEGETARLPSLSSSQSSSVDPLSFDDAELLSAPPEDSMSPLLASQVAHPLPV